MLPINSSCSVGDALLEMSECVSNFLDNVRSKYAFVAELPDGTVKELSIIPGDHCDLCGETCEALEGVKLMACAKCKQTYYCSVECQKKHWKEVHKIQCRKRGEFKVGDFAYTVQPFGSIPFVEIVAPDSHKPHHWLVSSGNIWDREEAATIPGDYLRRIPTAMFSKESIHPC